MSGVITKAISILDLLVPQGNEKELGVTEISQTLGMPVQSVHRLLASLCQHGLVTQNKKTKKYKLGLSLMKYGFLMQNSLEFRSIARPMMKELSKQTKETVYLAARENGEGVYIDAINAPPILKISVPIGLRLPLYIGAPNRVILAYLSKRQQEALITGVEWSTLALLKPLSPEYIQEDLDVIRAKGYSVTDGEVSPGTTGVGAPIFSYDNTVIGSINVAGPSLRFTESAIERHSFYVKKYAALISRELGYRERVSPPARSSS